MMFKIKVLTLLFILFSSGTNITEIRNLYSNVLDSEEKQRKFIAYMEKVDAKTSVIQAYKGAALTLESKNAKKIKDKKQFFIDGAELIEEAVKKDPENIEIRLIRLSVQESVPKFLKYHSNIEEDVALIKKNIDHIKDSELKLYVENYVKQSKSFK